MRKWYHFDTGNPRFKDKLCRHLRGLRVTFECNDLGLPYDMWRIRVLILDDRMLNDINRWLRTAEI